MSDSSSNPMMIFCTQLSLPAAASDQTSPVRLLEFLLHTGNSTLHLPPDGKVGQVLTMTENGPEWRNLEQ